MNKNLTLQESIQNPEWVAANITALRELFPVDKPANPVHVSDILVYTGKLAQLGVDPEEFGDIFLTFMSEVFQPLARAGVCMIEHNGGYTGIYIWRKRPEAFELAATDRQTEDLLAQEPSEESQKLADDILGKLLGRSA